ncbi:hypothetical protein [Lactobacillus sp. HT06-2]|uniref:hypothetical protein n=1 Tax=Lactobacillus sp. HT06-2 TaxID=2080222 RepID=UPI000CD95B6B|nr:hypothetical protein [Lactobacillus sp. HT06-2]
MAITTKDPHAWFVATNDAGETQTVYNNERYEHDYPFGFEVNFADIASPQQNTVTLYNMSKEHREFYQKKQHCYVAFNWGKDKKILAEGFITKIDVNQSDGVTDTLVITFTEGTDYNNLQARKLKVTKKKAVNKYKHITKTETYKTGKKKGQKHEVKHRVKYRGTKTVRANKTFRKGTDYKTIIKGIASQAGIKITSIDLAENPKMKRPYTAHGKPLTLLKKLVPKTKSKMVYIGGKLEIVNPKSNKRTWYGIDDQDLVQPPSYNEDGSDDEDGGTWEITIPLVPDITTNVGILMESKYLKGKYYVKSGQHTFDGENPQTQCSLSAI